MKIRNISAIATIILAVIFLTHRGGLAAATRNAGPHSGFDALRAELEDQRFENSDYKIIQGRNGEFEIGPAHSQYKRQCWLTCAQVIGEYLGYAMQVTDEHFDVQSDDFDGFIDVGYWGSIEHLLVHHTEVAPYYPNIIHSTSYTNGNTGQVQCSSIFMDVDRIPDYGECNGVPANYTWAGFDLLGDWPDGSSGEEIDLIADYLEWMLDDPLMGCNDYHDYDLRELDSNERDDARRIIKAFVDNNVPLLVRVNRGHNNVVIGYAELWSDGLPDTAILADAKTDVDSPDRNPLYRLAQNLHTVEAWNNGTRFSIDKIRPWHANLNQACEEGGWAKALDESLTNFSVCDTPQAPNGLTCAHNQNNESISGRRYFGINIECWDNGHLKHDFFATEENPFVTIGHNVTCDDLVVRYANLNDPRELASASVTRYRYDNTEDRWQELSTYRANALRSQQRGRHADQYRVSLPQWDSNYYMAADNLSSPFTKRRTTVDLNFNNGDHIYVELAPPRTYGVEVKCENGSRITEYWSEADHSMTWFRTPGDIQERQFIYSGANRVCDNVELTLRLGANDRRTLPHPTVTRYGYDTSAEQWLKMNASAPWSPDDWEFLSPTDTGLSGYTYHFRWQDVWPDNYRFVGTNLSDTRPERKTVFDVEFNRGSHHRQIEISPFSSTLVYQLQLLNVECLDALNIRDELMIKVNGREVWSDPRDIDNNGSLNSPRHINLEGLNYNVSDTSRIAIELEEVDSRHNDALGHNYIDIAKIIRDGDLEERLELNINNVESSHYIIDYRVVAVHSVERLGDSE